MVNKLFHLLDDKEWLRKERINFTAQEIANRLGCKRGSVEWACRIFSKEIKATFKYDRKGKKVTRLLEL